MFYYCAEINFALKRMYPKNMFYEVDQELGVGNCLYLHLCLGSGIVLHEQKMQIGGGGGGHGNWSNWTMHKSFSKFVK